MWAAWLLFVGLALAGCGWFDGEDRVTGPTVTCEAKTGDTVVVVRCPTEGVTP